MNIAEITEQKVTECAKAALPPELALHKIAFFHTKGNTRIVIDLDKESDPHGSVNIRDCETYARALRDALDEMEKASGINLNYSLEVASAGAERELKSLAEVKRFSALPVNVTFVAETGKTLSEILKTEQIEGEYVTFNVADCKANRKKYTPKKLKSLPTHRVAWHDIKKIRLHLDV
ncbi:Ribosome maturation factor rimP [Turneriella parva DSM 21527]|uniref:Ribosome maturation factor RimP n=2 Tax=Turneriella TaxID=338321 RepID=I4B7K7_TURPD|nr:Ribosome maturation factor rimP [Turneriella parva DSM 21527]